MSAMTENQILLDVQDLSIEYASPGQPVVQAVHDVSFTLRRGEFVGLVGESGSGKSTLGFALTRLQKPPARISDGRVLFGGRDIRELDAEELRRQIEARDMQIANPYSKDSQIQGIRNAHRYIGDRLGRVATPHRILDPAAGPLIGVTLHVLTRKTLGGIQTDLNSRALATDGTPIDGLYAAGEVAGFGGGGVHGYNALEGTFVGGCIFSGLVAGRALARSLDSAPSPAPELAIDEH